MHARTPARTLSNGTFLNGEKIGKSKTARLAEGDRIALYQPQGASPLGRPILYDLAVDESNFAQVIPFSVLSFLSSMSCITIIILMFLHLSGPGIWQYARLLQSRGK